MVVIKERRNSLLLTTIGRLDVELLRDTSSSYTELRCRDTVEWRTSNADAFEGPSGAPNTYCTYDERMTLRPCLSVGRRRLWTILMT